MRKLILRLLIFPVISLLLFVFSSFQSADFQIAWGKRVVDGDTLILTNGERVRLMGVDSKTEWET